jgi:hypothetical protein
MDALRQPNPLPVAQKAAPNIASCRHYLELLIADSNARGTTAGDEVVLAKEMLKRLEDVRFS